MRNNPTLATVVQSGQPIIRAGEGEASQSSAPHLETERVPRVTRLLALALKFEEMIRNGVVDNFTVLAELGQVSRARVSQMMNLVSLAPDIQEEILFLKPEEAKRRRLSEPAVRKLSAILDWGEQRAQWSRRMGCLDRVCRTLGFGSAESEERQEHARTLTLGYAPSPIYPPRTFVGLATRFFIKESG